MHLFGFAFCILIALKILRLPHWAQHYNAVQWALGILRKINSFHSIARSIHCSLFVLCVIISLSATLGVQSTNPPTRTIVSCEKLFEAIRLRFCVDHNRKRINANMCACFFVCCFVPEMQTHKHKCNSLSVKSIEIAFK